VKHRDNALKNNIKNWKDPECNSKILGFSEDSKLYEIVDNIIKVNRDNVSILPEKLNKWTKPTENEMYFFMDYETINRNMVRKPKDVVNWDEKSEDQFIFMIGVGYYNNGNFRFNNFTAKNISDESEKEILNGFWNWVNEELKTNNKKYATFLHWSKYETTCYKAVKNKYSLPEMRTIDLLEYMIENKVAIKGCMDYKLKSFVKALYALGKINSNYDSECKNGIDAMMSAIELYKTDNVDNKIMKDIEKYNMIDCQVMADIYNYFDT
jgi:hypothetical protein